MRETVMMADLSWTRFAEKVSENATVFIPVGATEQHGPYMGLGVDVIIPTAICEGVARNVSGLVAPAIPYGYKSQPRTGGGQAFPGTISLDLHTLTLVVRDVIIGLGRSGIRRIVILCGHFENVWPCIEAIDLALRDLLRDGIDGITVLRLKLRDPVRGETHDRLFPDGFPGTKLEHAALLETSMILKLRPDIVDMSKVPSNGPAQFPAYDRYPKVAGYLPPSGVLAPAERATAEQGQWLLDDHIEQVTKAVREGFTELLSENRKDPHDVRHAR